MLGPTEHTGAGEIPNTLLAGIGHMDVTGESSMPGFGGYQMPVVIWALGDMETTAVGDYPIGPARQAGVMDSPPARRRGDMETPPVI